MSPNQESDLWISLIFLGMLTAIPVVYVVSQLLSRQRIMKEKLNEKIGYRKEKLLNPKYRDVEKLFGRKHPHALKSLYERADLVCGTDFYFIDPIEEKSAWSISRFLPVCAEEVRRNWPDIPGACFFAETSRGQYYFVPFDPDPWAPVPVFVVYRMDEKPTKVSDSLTDFLNWPRVSATAYHKRHA